jgi:hypothetical protein
MWASTPGIARTCLRRRRRAAATVRRSRSAREGRPESCKSTSTKGHGSAPASVPKHLSSISACSQESRGAVRRAEESDRTAPTTSTPHEVRPRAVLPIGRRAETETAGAALRPRDAAIDGGNRVGTKEKQEGTRQTRRATTNRRRKRLQSATIFQQVRLFTPIIAVVIICDMRVCIKQAAFPTFTTVATRPVEQTAAKFLQEKLL